MHHASTNTVGVPVVASEIERTPRRETVEGCETFPESVVAEIPETFAIRTPAAVASTPWACTWTLYGADVHPAEAIDTDQSPFEATTDPTQTFGVGRAPDGP